MHFQIPQMGDQVGKVFNTIWQKWRIHGGLITNINVNITALFFRCWLLPRCNVCKPCNFSLTQVIAFLYYRSIHRNIFRRQQFQSVFRHKGREE